MQVEFLEGAEDGGDVAVGEAAQDGELAIGFALPVGIWWFYFRLLDRAELRRRVGGGQLLTYLHLPMTLAVVMMAASVEVSLTAFGDAMPRLAGPRMLFGGLAVWLACFLAMRLYVVGIRRLGAAEWTTAAAVAALAAGALLIGPVRALALFILSGTLLLTLAALGSLLHELRQRRAARRSPVP